MVTYAAYMACTWPDKISLPSWAVWTGAGLLVLSFPAILYSLFVNLPFRRTYITPGVGDKLVTSGFYALSRHPGVLWTVLFIIGLTLVSRSRLVLFAAPIYIVLDLVVVFLQDRYYFGRMFAGYEEYRKHTPMLIPNARSIRAFIRSWKAPQSVRSS
jgi:protein-S-isoprenylcysteine O-methyltransferase Ste14